jgi:flagellar M-ring protein FliF
VNNLLETLRQLGPARLAIMGSVLLGLLLFFIYMSFRVATPDMRLLYGELSSMDSGAMAAKLEESKITYTISPDGTRILVPEGEVGRARMLLAQAGLPNGGSMGYEIFDKQSGFGTTNFVQNINQVRALEGELARTVGALDSVRSARVHLVLPQRELFSRDTKPASASVFIGVRPGARLESGQIAAIQSLVASAVPDLKAERVSIIDQHGTLLASSQTEGPDGAPDMKAEEKRLAYEQRLVSAIEDLVGRTVGVGKVRATVTADLNFDRISTNEEIFDPQSQVVRSVQSNQETNVEREPPPKDVSVQNNLPGVTGGLVVDPKPTAENNKVGETTNYEISKTLRTTVREVGEVKKLSIAVLVDGTYATDDKGVKTYKPRDQKELDQIAALVRSASGFDEKRGDTIQIANMQFAEIEVAEDVPDERMLFGFEKADLLDMAEVVTVAIMIILVVLLVLQPMVGRLISTEGPSLDESLEAELLAGRPASPALTGPAEQDFEVAEIGESSGQDSLINVQRVEGKVKASSIKKVEDIVQAYPSETVSVLRSWMTAES